MSTPDPATTEWVPIWNSTPATLPVTAHAPTHASAGVDPVLVTGLAGYPGGTTLFLRADGTFAAPPGGTPTLHHVTHETGGTDALTALSAAILTTGSLPFARVQVSASPRLLGRGTAAAGAMEEITLGTGLSMTATQLSVTATAPAAHATTHNTGGSDPLTALSAAILTTGNLPFARVQLSASPRLLGRGTAAAGAMEEITLGTGLSMTATTLSITGADEVFIGTADPGATYELWYDTDEPGIDPTVLSHHVSHEPGGADALANAVWTNRSNVFTKNYAIGSHAISIQAQNPTMSLIETAAPVDARMWRFIAYGQLFYIMSTDDAETANLGALVMDRQGGLTTARTVNVKGVTPFLALTDMTQAVDSRAFIIQNASGALVFTVYNDAFTVPGPQPFLMDRAGNTRVCPVQTGNRLQFGGGTSAYPALRWTGTNLEVVLADNSNWAGLRCATLDCYSTVTMAATLTITGLVTANGGISCYSSITIRDGASPSVNLLQSGGYLRFNSSNYGQITYMDMGGNWTMMGQVVPVGGIEFVSTSVSASVTCLDYYKEIQWTPYFSFSAGGVPTYSIQHGLAVKIGRFVYFGGRCSLQTKGSMGAGGHSSLQGLPWVSEGTIWGGGMYAGYCVTTAIAGAVGGYIPPASQYVQLTVSASGGTQLFAPDWMYAGFDLIFFGSYYANS